MSQDIPDGRTTLIGFGRPSFSEGWVGLGYRLVALGWVEEELADEFPGGGVDDSDV